MKKMTHMGLVIILIFSSAVTIGQTQKPEVRKSIPTQKTTKTYLDLMVNIVSTNLNYGDANSDLKDFKKSNNGLQAGASFQAGITPTLSLVTELYYMRKGGKLKTNNPLTNSESNFRLHTVELPVVARLHFGKFYMNAGPSIAYNISGTNKIADVSKTLSFENKGNGFRRFDAGVQMGGGVEFPINQRRIALDIRYNYGLTNLSYDKEMYNRAVMVSIHFSKPWKTNPLKIK